MLSEGNKAPDFQLYDQNGNPVTLGYFKGKKVLVWFFPKASTPGWTIEGQVLRDEYKNFQEKNTEIIGISGDSSKAQKNFCDKQNFPFLLLSDPEKITIKAYGAFGPKKFMGKEYEGIYRVSYLIDEDGVIEKVYKKVKPKEHAAQVLSNIV